MKLAMYSDTFTSEIFSANCFLLEDQSKCFCLDPR